MSASYVLVIGPIASVELSASEKNEFYYSHRIKDKMFPIPVMFYGRHRDLLQLVFYLFSDKLAEDGELFEDEAVDPVFSDSEKELYAIEYRRIKHDEDHKHLPYKKELDFYNSIKNGIHINMEPEAGNYASEQEDFERIGILSVSGVDKQFEYTAISMISLATRAAIDGGVPPQEAYEISDLMLQKCSKCRSNRGYIRLMADASDRFISKVNEYKNIQQRDLVIDQCKDYVASHLFTKITVEEVADALHVSYTYLSTKFKKKTGISLTEYIRKEKLTAVKHYLVYSDVSIGEISERMAFISPSRMSEQFRKENGVSPGEYRKRNRKDAFSER